MLGLGCCVGLSLIAVSGGHSDCGAWASVGRGFCLDHRLLGTAASLLHSTWELPGSGIEPRGHAPRGQVDSLPSSHQGSPILVSYSRR